MNVGESCDLNVLLRYLLGDSGPNTAFPTPTGVEACEAAARLADKASNALMAGFNGDKVRALWAAAAPAPGPRPKGGAPCKRR